MAIAWQLLKDASSLVNGTAWQHLNNIDLTGGVKIFDFACGVEVEMSSLDLGGEMGAISAVTSLASVKANPVLEALDNELSTVFPPVQLPGQMMVSEQNVFLLDEDGNPIIWE